MTSMYMFPWESLLSEGHVLPKPVLASYKQIIDILPDIKQAGRYKTGSSDEIKYFIKTNHTKFVSLMPVSFDHQYYLTVEHRMIWQASSVIAVLENKAIYDRDVDALFDLANYYISIEQLEYKNSTDQNDLFTTPGSFVNGFTTNGFTTNGLTTNEDCDMPTSFKLMEIAACAGHAYAMFHLHTYYMNRSKNRLENDNNVNSDDIHKAYIWHLFAMLYNANYYFKFALACAKADMLIEAVKLFTLSYKLAPNCSKTQVALALCYYYKFGIPADTNHHMMIAYNYAVYATKDYNPIAIILVAMIVDDCCGNSYNNYLQTVNQHNQSSRPSTARNISRDLHHGKYYNSHSAVVTHVNMMAYFGIEKILEYPQDQHPQLKELSPSIVLSDIMHYRFWYENFGSLIDIGDMTVVQINSQYYQVMNRLKTLCTENIVNIYSCNKVIMQDASKRQEAISIAKIMKSLSDKFHIAACFVMAQFYLSGFGVDKSEVDGIKLLIRAAANGHIGAAYHLSLCYAKGVAKLTPNKSVQNYWLRRAAAYGCTHAMFMIEHGIM